eukprot:6208777-Pleurochrysis_carterae.AAC.3
MAAAIAAALYKICISQVVHAAEKAVLHSTVAAIEAELSTMLSTVIRNAEADKVAALREARADKEAALEEAAADKAAAVAMALQQAAQVGLTKARERCWEALGGD